MSKLYSEETVATASAIQEMNLSILGVIVGLVIFLFALRGFIRDVRSGNVTAVRSDEPKRSRKLPRIRARLRRLFRSLREAVALQVELFRQRATARKAVREADQNDSTRTSEILPSNLGDYTPIAPNGKPWDQYEEPAYIRQGVQLSF